VVLWFNSRGTRYDHAMACYWGGRGELSNCQVLCITCDAKKTKTDQGQIAKNKRVSKKYLEHLQRMAAKGR